MVVELCSSKKIGQFTGYYYTASMAAQTITPVLLGFILTQTLVWWILPIYSSVLILAACLVFFFLVKNIKAHKVENAKGLEAIDDN
jgi:MFS family permease